MNANYIPCKSKGKLIVIHVLAGIGMAIAFGFIFGYFVMLLWNFLMPDIFGLKEITFWQGAGLVVLSRLLFGTRGYGKHGHAFDKCHTSQNKDGQEIIGENEGEETIVKS
ncbi:MAG: hypothetical protein K0R78_1125 [Pelosinus sp.]|jgi:hypothetical protein|nr:hypothetical protein [Pelosinus sp.]